MEALEAFLLLSTTAQTFPDPALAHDLLTLPGAPGGPETLSPSDATWDEALGQSTLAELLNGSDQDVDVEAVSAGLSQLNRYLSRAWYRAAIPVQMHDDCTQAVYVTLLQNLGRDRFDALLTDIGQTGIRDVLSRETADGPDFFRAVDTVKKRAQRERVYQPLDAISASASNPQDETRDRWRATLREAIDHSLNPREAALIYATLKGETPAEIASQWGVAPKTVSNEKTRVIQKLRDVLVAHLSD